MEDKKYFSPGDLVVLNKLLTNAPDVMLVLGKASEMDEVSLKGIICLFFDKIGVPHECVFNTKDLMLYK